MWSRRNSDMLYLQFEFYPRISINLLRAVIIHGLFLLFFASCAQVCMTERTSQERCWWASTSESGNESLKLTKTTSPRYRRWRNSSLARNRWVNSPSLSIMLWTYIDPGSRNDTLSIPVMVQWCEMIQGHWLNMFLLSPIVCVCMLSPLCAV